MNSTLKAAGASWTDVLESIVTLFFTADIEDGRGVLVVGLRQGLIPAMKRRYGLLDWGSLREIDHDQIESICPDNRIRSAIHQAVMQIGIGTAVVWKKS